MPGHSEGTRGAAGGSSLLRQKRETEGHLSPEDGEKFNDLLRPFRSPWRDPAKTLPEGAPTVIRLRMADEGEITVEDRVQGRVKINATELDDLVLMRSDGTPTYMLAVVVDDHDMGVTHVIRGDDHLTNTFRQLPIYQGMGWPTPEFAHIPLIHGPDGKKLSKRHGALGVDVYRDMGYLPEGLKNYLLRLGWSHGDDEIIPEAQAIEWFDLDGLNKAAARLDLVKLNAVNAHYMALADDQRLADLFFARPKFRPHHRRARTNSRGHERPEDAITYTGSDWRSGALSDRPAAHQSDRQRADLVNSEAKERLRGLADRLDALPDWSEPAIKDEIARYCAEIGVGLGKVAPVLRAVLTGGAPSPDITLVLALLGRNECLARIQDQPG